MSTDVITAELEYINSFLPSIVGKPELLDFFTLKMKMLEERLAVFCVSNNTSFKTSATKKYLEACVIRKPGLTRQELREFASIPASPRRSEIDVFRDYLHALRPSIYIDENERCWPRNGLEMPIARIGSVILDGRVTKTAKTALMFIRDNPGASEADLRRALKVKTTKAFKNALSSLKNKVDCDERGRMFVKGYIPSNPPAKLPEKKEVRIIQDSVQEQVIDHMDFKVLYDWSELVEVYQALGMTPKEGFQHFTNMAAQGLIGTQNRKYFRIYS